VATLSVLLGAPQAEQKRPVAGTSVPQDEHEGMIFTDTVYRFGAGMCSVFLPEQSLECSNWNISFCIIFLAQVVDSSRELLSVSMESRGQAVEENVNLR
jgi:hypothetical protein